MYKPTHFCFGGSQWHPLHPQSTKLPRVLRRETEGTERVGASPSPSRVRAWRCWVLLSRCPILLYLWWWPASWIRTSRVCSRTGRFFLRKASDARLRGVGPVSGTVPIYLCCTGRGGSGQDPPSLLLLVALALFQLRPTRLLMGCLQAGLRQPGRQ